MKRLKSSKGLSPVVASVLLVALVIILAAIIFIWARGFIGEQINKDDKPVSKICEVAEFSVDLVEKEGLGLYDAEIVNQGNYAIFNFLIIKELDGNSIKQEFKFSVTPQGNIRERVDLKINGRLPNKVTFYPSVLGTIEGESSNRPFTCMDKGQVKELS